MRVYQFRHIRGGTKCSRTLSGDFALQLADVRGKILLSLGQPAFPLCEASAPGESAARLSAASRMWRNW